MEHARPPSELRLEGGPAQRAAAWRKWQQQFLVFLKASGLNKQDADVQASLLINLIGSEGYDVYTTFTFLKDENKEDLNTLLKKFNNHFGTKVNITMCRIEFFSRNQEAGESIDEYVRVLKLISQHCEFQQLEESLIRDRIVCGLIDGKVRDRLLRSQELTLHKVVRICRTSEISAVNKQQIEEIKKGRIGEKASSSSAAVDVVRQSASLVSMLEGNADDAVTLEVGERKRARAQERAPQPRSSFVTDATGRRRHLVEVAASDGVRQMAPTDDNWSDEESDLDDAENGKRVNRDGVPAHSASPSDTRFDTPSLDDTDTRRNKNTIRRPAFEKARMILKHVCCDCPNRSFRCSCSPQDLPNCIANSIIWS